MEWTNYASKLACHNFYDLNNADFLDKLFSFWFGFDKNNGIYAYNTP